jgi:hypothetical protein
MQTDNYHSEVHVSPKCCGYRPPLSAKGETWIRMVNGFEKEIEKLRFWRD